MDAGAEAHVDPQVDGHSSSAAEESGSNQNSGGRSEPSPLNQEEILRTLATVEKDSQAIAVSFSSLFVSIRSTLSEVRKRFCSWKDENFVKFDGTLICFFLKIVYLIVIFVLMRRSLMVV
ncbi:hypothetical protein Bca4012_066883 [Brassica carinata]|uniref:Uncharacterized protein n=1 Tax=Brassica carinata TaxID=52824 RepID=A0A8X7VR97_BRACI|nr:hypothetical protein Bca52824_019161 [Brassica carinata]